MPALYDTTMAWFDEVFIFSIKHNAVVHIGSIVPTYDHDGVLVNTLLVRLKLFVLSGMGFETQSTEETMSRILHGHLTPTMRVRDIGVLTWTKKLECFSIGLP